MVVRRLARTGLAAALLATGLASAVQPAVAQQPGGAAPARARATLPEPTTATVTADQLGPDSVVAVVTHGRFEKRDAEGLARSLEVITPDGVRHPVYSVDVKESRRGWFHGDFAIADWRPELHAALLRVSLGKAGDKAVSYDVTTGAMREVVLPQRASTVALAPDGTGLLMTTYPGRRRAGRVGLLDWSGATTWLPAKGDGPAITSLDGRTLVTVHGRRWWLTDLLARTSTTIHTPGECLPRRWSDADSVIATCLRRRGSQLREVDLSGRSYVLGRRHDERSRRHGPPVFEDADVRSVRGRAWYESYGGCGGGFLTRTTRDNVKVVRVPGSTGAIDLVGERGKDLVIAHVQDDCVSRRTRGVLSLFDPRAEEETVLTRLRRTEAWRELLPATEVRSWIW